ncbi:MAG: hypothetical protein HZC50_00805 [Nitrospirae bacterium]|nr:hypothetical protein [Nitrospirota bacterium]
MTLVTPDTELTLSYHDQRAVVSPWGASLRRYFFIDESGQDIDIVWGYSGGTHKRGGQGDVLIPFPGRIGDGRYSFDGQRFQLECNDKEGPNAIHGFVRSLPWQAQDVHAHKVTFEIRLDAETYAGRGYPFSLAISVMYDLSLNVTHRERPRHLCVTRRAIAQSILRWITRFPQWSCIPEMPLPTRHEPRLPSNQ